MVYIEINNITRDNAIFSVNNISNKNVDTGIIINSTMAITAIATTISPNLNNISLPIYSWYHTQRLIFQQLLGTFLQVFVDQCQHYYIKPEQEACFQL
mgnify:CR=1 FL=1